MNASHPTRPPELRWAGTEAFLLDCGELPEVVRWHAHLADHPLPGQVDVIAAARTVLVVFSGARAAREAASAVGSLRPAASDGTTGRTVEIPVVYDGADLAEVARVTGLSEQGVVEAHTGAAWTSAFGGFAPGFVYLTAADDPLDVPRRTSPRTAVPAGAVGLAGTYSAIYPRRSPGGWQLIGRTDAVLWDEFREPPVLIRPGDTVRYRAVRELVPLADDAAAPVGAPGKDRRDPQSAGTTSAPEPGGSVHEEPAPPADETAHATRATPDLPEGRGTAPGARTVFGLTVAESGMQTLVQDLGRPGLGDLGVVTSGAADRVSAVQANRLVGNHPGAAVLEVTLGGLGLTARGHHVLALGGAPVTGTITTPVGDDAREAVTRSEGRDPARSAPVPGHPSAVEEPRSAPSAEGHGDAAPRSRPDDLPAESHTRPVPFCAPFALYDGEHLTLDAPSAGLRSYVAVRGGIDVPEVLGSRATDVMSGIGPLPVAAGDELPVRRVPVGHTVGLREDPEVDVPGAGDPTELRILLGPRDDWFTPGSREALEQQSWRVSGDSNRVGVRLEAPQDGTSLERSRTDEPASEGVAIGSLQVPHSGAPVLFLADHPVTGGYPVIAVVLPEDLPLAAQLAPGAEVRFRPVGNAATATPPGSHRGTPPRDRPTPPTAPAANSAEHTTPGDTA
ncbi:5-oxoprolinase subunit B/C family protein [Kocuria tytonis]|uniref:Carboxyltransferase domain-containing protein n=1 Tax=Kocuria tytonis TaxID=2054280 RepID=A0A495AA06_9MICC|nr:carboxyltransferase domain-containing protein [Kocuria tytonis]RKQ35377.1 carboxyltransferase domain-containing protein [Kocuria tytonis]